MALIAFGLLGITAGIVVWSGRQIASPPRRALMDYHREFLSAPGDQGMAIRKFTASDGTPCLVCEPAGSPGKRGEILRRQLGERGLTLAPFGRIQGTLVLVHGRMGRKEDYLPIAVRLCAAGFRCLIPDLPGHGDHPLPIATYGVREAGLPAMVMAEAAREFRFEPGPAGLMGLSMGGSIAMHAADQPGAPWRALVVVASFDTLSGAVGSQARRRIGRTAGSWWLEGAAAIYQQKSGIPLDSIRPVDHAARLRIPTLIAHGTADTAVPMALGRHLFEAVPAATPKRWVEIPGAGHDKVLVTGYPIYADIAEWMLRHVSSLTPAAP